MTREQAKKNLIGFGIEEPTEEQISNYLNQVNGETQKEKEKTKTYKEKAEKYDQTQKELEEEKLKNMTAEEKLAEAEKTANEKAIEFAKKTNRLDAEKILVEAGLAEDDYKDLIDGIISDDAETTKTMATSLASMVSKQKEAAVQKTKEELMDGTKTAGGWDGTADDEDAKTSAEKFAEKMTDNGEEDDDSPTAIIDMYK